MEYRIVHEVKSSGSGWAKQGKVPDGRIAGGYEMECDTAYFFDTSVVGATGKSYLKQPLQSAVAGRATFKHKLYDGPIAKLPGKNEFYPFVFEAQGGTTGETVGFMHAMWALLNTVSHESADGFCSFVWDRVAVALANGNARVINAVFDRALHGRSRAVHR